jgi:hypothetical protein
VFGRFIPLAKGVSDLDIEEAKLVAGFIDFSSKIATLLDIRTPQI